MEKQQQQKQQQQKQQQQKQQQQKTHKHQKQRSNMNGRNVQSLTERKTYENDSKKIENEINDLQGIQYDYLNNGLAMDSKCIPIRTHLYMNKPTHGNHFNRSRMLSKPGSFVPGHMANDVNEFERRMPLPYDRGGDISKDGGNWNGSNENDGQNYQNENKFYDNYNHGLDYSRYHDKSHGYNSHGRNSNNLSFTRFDPINDGHSPRLDYGLSTKRY